MRKPSWKARSFQGGHRAIAAVECDDFVEIFTIGARKFERESRVTRGCGARAIGDGNAQFFKIRRAGRSAEASRWSVG